MNTWIILEYEYDRPHDVICRNINRLGIVYYNPIELRIAKSTRNAPQAKSVLKEHPLLAGTVFLCNGPEVARKAMSTQYTQEVVSDCFEKPLEIPEYQIMRFRESVTEYNDGVRRLWEKGQALSQEKRKKFVKMSLEVLADYKSRAFGREQAA